MGGDGDTDKDTLPLKPLILVTVIVEVPAAPALLVTDVGAAAIAKSWIVKVTGAECERLALVPVTVTV